MKKIIFLSILIFIFSLILPVFSFANNTTDEEIEGKEIWEKLQAKTLNCQDLSDGSFERLGEYFMGQMMGESHEAMNVMMEQMIGQAGEERMHVVMGQRMSGCNTTAQMPQNMANMMAGRQTGDFGNGMPIMFGNMMNWSNGSSAFSWLGWLFTILFWVLIVLGVIALIKWIVKK